MATSSINVIPTISIAVSSTLAASLAPPTPLATTFLETTEATSVAGASGEKATKLVKAMEEMSIQATKNEHAEKKGIKFGN